MIRPRLLLCIVLYPILAWLLLALAWAFLPSPSSIANPTDILLSGKTLVRVYDTSNFHTPSIHRSGFALDFSFNPENHTLSILGLPSPLPIIHPEDRAWQQLTVSARVGDDDGANLPWFRYADSILLFWQIHKETVEVPVTARWKRDEENGVFGLDVQVAGSELLLRIGMKEDGTEVEVKAQGAGPSLTYPVRVAIITVLAPVSIYLNDFFGGFFGVLWSTLGYTLGFLLVVVLYGFMIGAVVVSVVRLVSGPSLEDSVQAAQDRLDRWNQNERLKFLRLGAVQMGVDRMYHNERVRAVIEVCRHGWHPERNRRQSEEQATEETDIEKGDSSK